MSISELVKGKLPSEIPKARRDKFIMMMLRAKGNGNIVVNGKKLDMKEELKRLAGVEEEDDPFCSGGKT